MEISANTEHSSRLSRRSAEPRQLRAMKLLCAARWRNDGSQWRRVIKLSIKSEGPVALASSS